MTEEGRKYRLEDIFDAPSISQGITKNFCQENKGDIPVFGSSKNEQEVIGYIADKIKKIRYYKDCITYNRNGSVGYVFYRKGKFVANEDARVLILKDHFKDKVLYDYLKYVLEIILMRNFNYSNKAGINKVMQLEVVIPSIETQNVIISKLDSIKEVKEKIILYASKITLSKVVIDYEDGVCFATVKICDIFNIEKGKSKYTKSHTNKHKGQYPVYSSQTSNEGIIANIDTYDYDCKCLTWTTDGTYVGTVFLRDGKFSMTTHCGALFLREELRDKVSLEYMQATLNNILPLHKEGEGSNKRLGVTKIEKIQIDIPIDEKNNYNIEAQKRIAKRYSQIKEIKENIKSELAKIENIKVDIGL